MNSAAVEALRALAALSARLGEDATLVQGGGGNTSLKLGDDLWVKASGTWLAHARARDIFVHVPLAKVRATLLEPDAEARLALELPRDGLRPSIETSLHALMPQHVVLHVHAVNTIGWAVRPEMHEELEARLDGLDWLWIPYRKPGHSLTRVIAAAMAERATPPEVLVLANHGLVVGADDHGTAEALLHEVERRLALPQREPPAPDHARLQRANDVDWRLPSCAIAHALATDTVACRLAQGGALYPDHVVFLGARAPVLPDGEPLSRLVADRPSARYALLPGAGVLVHPELSAGAQAMLECLALVALRLPHAGSVRYLAEAEVAALLDWEAEHYRRALPQPAQATA